MTQRLKCCAKREGTTDDDDGTTAKARSSSTHGLDSNDVEQHKKQDEADNKSWGINDRRLQDVTNLTLPQKYDARGTGRITRGHQGM